MRRFRARLWPVFASAAFLAFFASARTSAGAQNAAALHAPAGARVAIVEFSDMECPACAATNPLLMQAVAQYKIPWERHDFLIPYHIWSPSAAIYARWFDQRGNGLGNEYRNTVFANQRSIETRIELVQFTGRFAESHGIALPFAIDPQGKLAAEVQADVNLGKRIGITQTPTIFIVMAHPSGPSYIKVENPQTDLYQDIDRALQETRR